MLLLRDYAPDLFGRLAQTGIILAVIMQRFDGYAALDGGFA